jgi:predicted ATP-grasp superfamily ATP-dependent carboligase
MVWMTVLKLVPWGEVVKNAPLVAEGAKKLWDKAGQGAAAPPVPPVTEVAQDAGAAASAHDLLAARLAEAEASVAQLHEQMQAASKLINALAEQNAKLVARVEAHRTRMLWMAAWVALAGAIALVALVAAFSGAR